MCEQGSIACGKEFPGACCKVGSVCGIGECVPGNGTVTTSGEVERLRFRFLLVAWAPWAGILVFVGAVGVGW